MIFTIILSILILVAINFLLLAFSCNKTKKVKKTINQPVIHSTKVTNLPASQKLAPTGS